MSCPTCNQMPCGISVTKEQVIKSLFVRNKVTGCVYLNACLNNVSLDDCDQYEPVVTCGTDLTVDQVLMQALDVNDCDQTYIRIINFSE